MKISSETVRDHTARFDSTRWSLVLDCSGTQQDPVQIEHALGELCQIYWQPVYTFLRRRGFSPPDSQDLTQGFFAHFLRNRGYTSATPVKGRFRSFLLGSLKNFVADNHAAEATLKRGGGHKILALTEDLIDAEPGAFIDASPGSLSPNQQDAGFDRHWAVALVRRVLDALREEVSEEGKREIFDAISPLIGGDGSAIPEHETIAAKLNMPVNTLRTHLHRLRARFRTRLREEVARTVETPAEVDEELHYLFRVLVSQ